MKHKNFTTRAELLRAAADSIEMQEKTGEPMYKDKGFLTQMRHASFWYNLRDYEFPLAVVEGKPVWEGDELWNKESGDSALAAPNSCWEKLSWNPPKPKTVMVELRVDAMQYQANTGLSSDLITEACRKALKEMK